MGNAPSRHCSGERPNPWVYEVSVCLTCSSYIEVLTWSMSTSDAAVQVAPSYVLYQLPEVEVQAESVTTPLPSRLRTVSRVLQVPDWVIQWGNRSRE
jgi:hypothetical protein